MSEERCIVVLPTYNERENIGLLLDELLGLPLSMEILVVDDSSPDGTAGIVEEYAQHYPRVHLLQRTGGRGRGSAGLAGFRQALGMGASIVVEMDADFSHQPRYLPAMLEALHDCDVVVGSRFVPGGADHERGWGRRLVSRLAGAYVRLLLGLKIRDVSSGFRCFRHEVLEQIGLDRMFSTGPSIVLEILYKIVLANFKVCEVPIAFTERRQGESKLNARILLQTLLMVIRLRWFAGASSQRR